MKRERDENDRDTASTRPRSMYSSVGMRKVALHANDGRENGRARAAFK